MKRIFILLTSMFLLVGCIESLAVIGSTTNGKLIQSSLQSGISFGIKNKTGKTPLNHALDYVAQKKTAKEKNSCSTFTNKKDLEICLMLEKRTISNQAKKKNKEFTEKPSEKPILHLRSSINNKSKIKYLD